MYLPNPIGSTDPLEDAAWRSAADALAAKFAALYVNRTDRYGGYRWQRERDSSGPWKVEAVTLPEDGGFPDVFLPYLRTHALNAGQFRPVKAGRGKLETKLSATVGAHFTHPKDDTCKVVRIDLDAHGKGATPETATRNMTAATEWVNRLRVGGFRPLLWDSDGRGGLWIDVFFARPIPATLTRCFGRWIVADWAKFELPGEPEVFPKQYTLRHTDKNCGSWARLPGMHYRRGVWSRIWDGGNLLVGADAISRFLAVTGDDPDLIPKDVRFEADLLAPGECRPTPVPVPTPRGKLRPLSEDETEIGVRLLWGACRVVGHQAEGQGKGRNTTANYLGWVGKQKGLSFDRVLSVLREWNAGNLPPLSDRELESAAGNGYAAGTPQPIVERRRPQRPAPMPLPTPTPKAPDPARSLSSRGVDTPVPSTPDTSSSSLEESLRAGTSGTDDTPAPERAKCRHGRPFLMEGVGRQGGRQKIVRPPCNRWACPDCNVRMRADRKAKYCPVVSASTTPVGVFDGPPEAFDGLRAHVQRLTGSTPRVCTVRVDDDRLVAVFLDAPESPRLGRVEPAAASDLLASAIDSFLVVAGTRSHPFRPINASRNFLPPEPPKPPPQWRKVGPNKLTREEVVALLREHAVFPFTADWSSLYPDAGGRPVTLMTWAYPATMPLDEQADINRTIVTGVIPDREPGGLADFDSLVDEMLAPVDFLPAPGRAYLVELASPPPTPSRVEERGPGSPLPREAIRWRYADEVEWRSPGMGS